MAYTTIDKSSLHFNTKLYTGNGSTNAQTGVGFTPSFTWIKNRGDTHAHVLVDAVRGVTKELRSNGTNAEITTSNSFTSFDSDGFTLGADSTDSYNKNSNNYVSWNWLANGQGSSNTDGTINTTYTSVNTTSGVSIIKYNGNGSAGATIGHGLGVAPKFVMIKRTDTSSNWIVGTGARGFDKFLYLNTNDAETDNAGTFNDTNPSSSVITLGSWNDVNNASGTYICYAFAEKQGFSKFGSYTGNGSTDGAFIYTGFKPAFVLVKNTAITDNWSIFDNKRIGYNAFNYVLYADITNVGSNGLPMDILSNGFKWRTDAAMVNGSGNNHIFMAFAEAPLVSSNGVPATAR